MRAWEFLIQGGSTPSRVPSRTRQAKAPPAPDIDAWRPFGAPFA